MPLAIVIPSKNERFLSNTINDVLKNATGEVKVYPILDGYEPPEQEISQDPRVRYIRLEPTIKAKKRDGINFVAGLDDGCEYIMALDAHCMVARGFDEVLLRDLKGHDDWVMIPRRNRLDAEKWCLQDQADKRPPIDYEYLMYPKQFTPRAFHGFKWDKKTLERMDTPIDDIITFQGSCWVMSKKWFHKCGFMQIEGYTGWGQEAEEISFKTWSSGGRVVVNKNTWYAHLHKGEKYGRMYYLPKKDTVASYLYAYDLWTNKNKEFFIDFVKKFAPMPGWPKNWEKDLYE